MADRERGGAGAPGEAIRLFLCGDVMTGRGIDQALPHPGDPTLHESFVHSAAEYLALAERANGPIARPLSYEAPWGDALDALERLRPDLRIVNLETSITRADDWVDKGINYRMSPDNVGVLTAAGIDCCVLANNHVLDWGRDGLLETLDSLERAGFHTAGAGRDGAAAEAPAALEVPGKGRVLVFAFGSTTSGVPRSWAAGPGRPGIVLLKDLSRATLRRIAARIQAARAPGDLVVASIHWGGNWGYEVPANQRRFAHGLIETAGVDLVHGHSSHHPKGIEVYGERPLFYGCGDFLNDYEGIGGYEAFRDDLTLAYLVSLAPGSGRLLSCEMVPLQIRSFRLNRASRADARWLREILDEESARFATRVEAARSGGFRLAW